MPIQIVKSAGFMPSTKNLPHLEILKDTMNGLKKKKKTTAQFKSLISLLIDKRLRLCFVHVKYFLENKYFSEMLFSGKENIFKCLVAF